MRHSCRLLSQPVRQTGASNSITIRLRLQHQSGVLARATASIAQIGGNIGAIDLIRHENKTLIRDVTVDTAGGDHASEIVQALGETEGVEVISWSDRTFLLHLAGKLEMRSKVPLKTRDELSMAYTPGVARVCMAIAEQPSRAWNLTIRRNTVAVVSDGTAVLGLGDIGPLGAMPVMEGKAQLFKEFAGVDAWPLCLDMKDTEGIIQTVKAIAPSFGGINLEDISAPRCFEIERRLNAELDIPVFHDDQHGTAVVFAAAFLNAMKVVGKHPADIKVVVIGVGASGTACTDIMMSLGVRNVVGCDRVGALTRDRTDLNEEKRKYAERTNPNQEAGTPQDVLRGADLLVGLSGPDVVTAEDLKHMAEDRIVFAMSNPTPEVDPLEAEPLVRVMATGRSDFPNQINNVLCFPGLFRGCLDCRATTINEPMKLAAARAIADCIPETELCEDYIIPSVFNESVVPAVAHAVMKAAVDTGVARHVPASLRGEVS